jgi:predicted O-methyltransferase YrrM
MSIRSLAKQIPLIVFLHKTFLNTYNDLTNLRKNLYNSYILKRLRNTSHPNGVKLCEALANIRRELPASEQKWITLIENERKKLICKNELLNDGSLGAGGLYDDQVTIKQACMVSKGPKAALMLYLLTRYTKPKNVIELGTNVGISSAYIAAALKVNAENGKLTTLEASPYRLRLAKELHCNLGFENISYVKGLFADTLAATLANEGSIDLAFIDGHHQYQPTLDYFEEIYHFANHSTVFVFDDIRWSEGMKNAWSQIQSDERLCLIVYLFSVGICLPFQGTATQRSMFPPIKLF